MLSQQMERPQHHESRDGASAGFTALLQPHLDSLRRISLRLTRNPNDSQDLLQDVLLKLYVHRYRLPYVRELKPWLIRVLYHQFVDQCRRRAAERAIFCTYEPVADDDGAAPRPALEDFPDEAAASPETCVSRLEVCALLGRALESLSESQRQVVALHDVEGLSLPEISQQTQIPLNTLKSSLARARARLREHLAVSAAPDPGLSRRRFDRGRTIAESTYGGNRLHRYGRRRRHGMDAVVTPL